KDDPVMAGIEIKSEESEEDGEEMGLAVASAASINPDILQASVASRSGGFLITRNQTTIREQMNDDLETIKTEIDSREDSLTALKSAVEERQERLDNTPSIWPVNNPKITSTFGYRRSPFGNSRELHKGIDLAVRHGSPVHVTHDGIVTFAGWRSGYGYTVIVDNNYGYSTLYAHNSSLLVKKGTRVKKGDRIAKVGSTGRSTGAHLHYEVRVNGLLVNPREYMK
ncbi:MAG TPA: M23 family metallopeptidase, partial [Thermoanaerobacterales bacterium]|nr:M23 family metallopeptidase [Thermoanaerobacterales bacterium]